MRQAVVCKCANQEDWYAPIFRNVPNLKLNTFYSADDGLEYFWNHSHDIEIVVFQRDLNHFDELFQAAQDWPGVNFLVQNSGQTTPKGLPDNLKFIETNASADDLAAILPVESQNGLRQPC